MKHAKFDLGQPPAGLGKLLPNGFDQNVVEAFFKGGEKAASRLLELTEIKSDRHLIGSEDDSKSYLDDGLRGKEPDAYDFGSLEDSAFAKPAHAGKGGSGTSGEDGSGTSGKGGGKGRDNSASNDDPNTTTDPVAGPDDGSTPDPAPAPEPEPTPAPAPTPSPEPAPAPSGGNYVSGLDTPGGYNIEVEFVGGWTDQYKASLINVVEMISDIVVGDLPSYNGQDDFHLKAVINAIDGTGGYLGVGGTLVERAGSFLPSNGYFRFDEADIANSFQKGNFEDVIFHEVLHAMGFGTIWSDLGLVKNVGGALRFTGEFATEMYNTEYASIAAGDAGSQYGVPLSADGSHWNHAKFTTETMTTSLYPSGNHVSDMTIAALQDMGYQTLMADEFLFS